jgi:hypothetical protein
VHLQIAVVPAAAVDVQLGLSPDGQQDKHIDNDIGKSAKN